MSNTVEVAVGEGGVAELSEVVAEGKFVVLFFFCLLAITLCKIILHYAQICFLFSFFF